MNEEFNIILKRRSVRKYLPDKVEEEKLILLLQAAMAAPSACNSQPWEFVVITEDNILKDLQSTLYSGNYQAPAAIAVCGNPTIGNNSAARHFWIQDCSAAAENILIAATALDLGSVWIGVHPLLSVIKHVSKILNLPDHVVPLCVIFIGYPAETKKPRTKYDEKRIYWQQYETRKKRAKIRNAKKKE